MLSDYISQRFQEIIEKTYYKLVLILALTSMLGVVLSGLSLIADYTLRYLALVSLFVGLLYAKTVLRNTSKKLRKLLERPEDEIRATRYFQILKDVYTPEDYLSRISEEPRLIDPVVKKEKRHLEAGRELLKTRYMNIEARMKTVVIASALAIAVPHVVITKDLLLVILAVFLAVFLRKN